MLSFSDCDEERTIFSSSSISASNFLPFLLILPLHRHSTKMMMMLMQTERNRTEKLRDSSSFRQLPFLDFSGSLAWPTSWKPVCSIMRKWMSGKGKKKKNSRTEERKLTKKVLSSSSFASFPGGSFTLSLTHSNRQGKEVNVTSFGTFFMHLCIWSSSSSSSLLALSRKQLLTMRKRAFYDHLRSFIHPSNHAVPSLTEHSENT